MMLWILLGLLVYLQIGAVLVAWLFGGLNVEAGRYDVIYLILLWPLALPLFRFLLYSRSMLRALQELEEDLD